MKGYEAFKKKGKKDLDKDIDEVDEDFVPGGDDDDNENDDSPPKKKQKLDPSTSLTPVVTTNTIFEPYIEQVVGQPLLIFVRRPVRKIEWHHHMHTQVLVNS